MRTFGTDGWFRSESMAAIVGIRRQRYQPGSAEVNWFRARVNGAGARMHKVIVVALARKLLIALWRFATQGVIPGGVVMKPAA